ncbi:MAG: EVE domain-containing protein [Gemmatimonadota bacterium]|nr:EVE domain-containing protein [Gemmatimonadota bacterium]
MAKSYWLAKTEPYDYSIQDLERDGQTQWDGVRNYQARNFMRDKMQTGDQVLIYHSMTDVLGVYGIAEVAGPAHPDTTQFDKKNKYFDEKSTEETPRWWCVDFTHVETFDEPVTRDDMKAEPGLAEMKLLKRGMRLSVMPVEKSEFDLVKKMSRR